MSQKHNNLLRWMTAAGLVCSSAFAATNVVNFNTATELPFKEVGAAAAEYRTSGGASGGATDGYLSITDAKSGQRATVVFDDLDKGLVVKAFTFECDLRIGGGTARPADGFSLNYVRANDPLAADGSPYAGTGNETNLPEEGSLTGLGIGFDTWQSGDHPGGITDVVGISVRVEGALITQLPVPLRPGNVWPGGTFDEVPFRNLPTTDANYASSMQTGALNTTDDLNGDGTVDGNDSNAGQVAFDDPNWGLWVKNLKWEKFKAQLTEEGKVKIFWKGVELTPAGGLASSFSPSPGRLVFGGRTGGAWEVHHVDNIRLETIPANDVIIGGVVGNPIGFSVTTVDSGEAVAVTSGLSVKLNGTDISSKVTSSKDGISTTIVFGDAAAPLAAGSTNTVAISIKDTRGNTVSANRTFVVGSYVTIPATLAVTGVNTAQKGFNVRTHQTARRGQPNTIARAEQQLLGLRGDNVADLTGFTGGVFAETGVINYSQPVSGADATPGQNGAFSSSAGNPARQIADNAIPGIPSASEFQPNGDLYTDNIAAEITTFLQFPTAGVYRLTFNSDDGFRTTVSGNNKEVLTSLIVSQADVGKGASDVDATVFVPEAGFYPFRTVWFEGGGGANLEWSAERLAPNPSARLLINDGDANAVKAFRARTGDTPAAVSFIHPFRGSGGNYIPTVPVVVSVADGSTPHDSFALLVDGAAVTPTKASSGGVTTYTFKPASNFTPGAHSVVVRFKAGSQTYDATNSFNIANAAVVPGSLALPASAVNTGNKGFLVKTVQQANGESMGNDTYRGQTHIAGLIGTPNVADLSLFTGPQGYYVETGVINYNQDAVSSGFFPDDPGVPGIPGTTSNTDNFAQEILTVLDLKAGFYCFNVNSDDGFRLDIGNPGEAFTFPLVVGEFSGGRGNGGDIAAGTTFFFEVKADGLYPARLVWYEGGGGANVEFSARQFDPVTGDLLSGTLINADGGIKAYQYPLASKGVPFVRSFAPARTGRSSGVSPFRAGTDAAITALVSQGTGPALSTANVSVLVDGVAATPTVTTVDGIATVTVAAPAGGWGGGTTHKVDLTVIDRTVSWTFGVANLRTPTFFIEAEDFDNNGAAPSIASAMPYRGGALAGQPASNNKDYTRGNEGASPIYRIGEDPQVPMDRTGDRDRGVGEVNVNYKMGWIGAGQWYQYTRNFPAGEYNVYAALSHGDGQASATRMKGEFATVASGSPTVVGSFDYPSTGGWGNNALVPMRNADGSLATVSLSGQQTVRYNASNGDYDFLLFTPAIAGKNVLSKDDTIVPTSANSPGAEGVAKVIDGDTKTKYLNFDKLNTGFTVTPKSGASVVTAISLTTANDAPPRDPATWTVLGSNNGTDYEVIATGPLAAHPARFRTETLAFSNTKAYTSYRVLFPTVVDAGAANSMQIAEVALIGTASGGGGGDAPRFTGIKANADGTITITWTGGGTLQSATSLSGPWTDVAGATSPLTVPANQAAQFARIRK